ncbi:DUF309 domain-containing protein [Cohnella suwonensis]|uniref:DUF309 domain-containing protein n=1 Tax=Cohnella suwonensis TaxID=696072 RepID=A0ABW0LRP2_9BACL
METLPVSQYPQAYVDYLAEYYGSRDYFECHEIMEEYWKEHPDSPQLSSWLVFIRIAVCLYHARRGNWKGAAKLMGKAAQEADAEQFGKLGMDGAKLKEALRSAAQAWSEPNAEYADIELPIVDAALRQAAIDRCGELGYSWGIRGEEAGEDVIHRHLTRDRTEVVRARAESAERKANGRG